MRDISADRKQNKESGMMVVEAVLSLMIFIMTVLCITFLINVYMVHNKIQFAINSAAHELASYLYLYEVSGLHEVHKDGDEYVDKLADTRDHWVDSYNKMGAVGEALTGADYGEIDSSIDNLEASLDQSISDAEYYLENPNEIFVGLIYGGYERLESGVVGLLMKGLSSKYLVTKDSVNPKSADEYLKGYGVVNGYSGLDFSNTEFLKDDDGKLIDVVVEYDLEVIFLGLFKDSPNIHVVQRVSVPAWLCGDGAELEDYGIE